MNPPKISRSINELSVALGCTRRTVSSWLKMDGNPGRRSDGSFSVTKWQKWISETGLGTRTNASEKNPVLDPLRREKMIVQTQKIALETESVALGNQIARGTLANELDVCKVVLDPYRDFIQELKGVKHRVGHIVSGQTSGDAASILGKELTGCLARWSLPEVYRKHPFYGQLKAELARLNAELAKEGGI